MTDTRPDVVAIDIGGTSAKLGLITPEGEIRGHRRVATLPPAADFIDSLIRGIESLMRGGSAASIGISVAGFTDAAHSAMIYNPNIPWLEGYPLRFTLKKHFQIPVELEADSNAAVLGEFHLGAGIGSKRLLCLIVGTGIGGGFMADGELVRFTHECLGDIGHVIVEPDGPECTCGGLGCAEAVATSPAILAASGVPHLEQIAPEDPVFAKTGNYLGLLCASLASIFFPDRIVLGGGVCAASGQVIAAAQDKFERSASTVARRETHILPAKLGAHAPLIGAACLFRKPSR